MDDKKLKNALEQKIKKSYRWSTIEKLSIKIKPHKFANKYPSFKNTTIIKITLVIAATGNGKIIYNTDIQCEKSIKFIFISTFKSDFPWALMLSIAKIIENQGGDDVDTTTEIDANQISIFDIKGVK